MAKDIIARLKVENSQWNKGLSDATKALKSMEKQFGLNITSISKFTVAAGAITGAMKVMKDAFMASEANVDAWKSTIESGKGVYEGFLNSLNTGDFSGFLNNIQNIVNAAHEAYAALDDLQTFKAFNQVNDARHKSGYTNALDDYKLNPTADNKKKLEDANNAVIKDLETQGQKAQKAYRTALESAATKAGLWGASKEAFLNVFSNGDYETFDSYKGRYNREGVVESAKNGWIGRRTTFDGKQATTVGGLGYWGGGQNTHKMDKATSDAYLVAEALYNIGDDDVEALQKLGADAYALDEAIAQQNKSYHRMSGAYGKKTGGGGGGKGAETITGLSIKEIQGMAFGFTGDQVTEAWEEIMKNVARQQEQDKSLGLSIGSTAHIEDQMKQMQEEMKLTPLQLDIDMEYWQNQLNEAIADAAKLKKMQDVKNTASGVQEAFSAASSALGQFSSQSKEAAKAAEMFTIAGSIAQLVAQFAAIPKGAEIWSWIAGTIAGTGTLVASIASIKSASKGYAEGGILGGAFYSSDVSVYRGNSGEMVINQTDQKKLYNAIHGEGLMAGGGGMEVRLSGENIVASANAYLRRSGQKQIGV